MDIEKVLHNGLLLRSSRNWMTKLAGKLIEIENHSEWSHPYTERQKLHLFTYIWILNVNSIITKLQFMGSQRLGMEYEIRGWQIRFSRKGK